QRDRPFRVAIPLEVPAAYVVQPARLPTDHTLGDEVALALVGLRDQRVERGDQRGGLVVRAVERDLVADGRGHAGIEREQERLDVAALVIPFGAGREREPRRVQEVEDALGRAVVSEPEAPLRGAAAAREADLLVEVAQLRNLHVL